MLPIWRKSEILLYNNWEPFFMFLTNIRVNHQISSINSNYFFYHGLQLRHTVPPMLWVNHLIPQVLVLNLTDNYEMSATLQTKLKNKYFNKKKDLKKFTTLI